MPVVALGSKFFTDILQDNVRIEKPSLILIGVFGLITTTALPGLTVEEIGNEINSTTKSICTQEEIIDAVNFMVEAGYIEMINNLDRYTSTKDGKLLYKEITGYSPFCTKTPTCA